MGIEKRTLSLKASDEEARKADEIVELLSPFVESRSHALRLGLNILHALVTMKDTVSATVEVLQGILRKTSYTQAEFHFPPQRSFSPGVGEEGAGSLTFKEQKRPRVVAFSASRRVHRVALEGTAYTSPSFLTGLRSGRSVA